MKTSQVCAWLRYQGGQWLERIVEIGCDAAGINWTTDICNLRSRLGDKVALQGNMNPEMLHASPKRIREELGPILASYGNGSGHVFNLRHNITPAVNPDYAGAFIDAVQELSGPFHIAS